MLVDSLSVRKNECDRQGNNHKHARLIAGWMNGGWISDCSIIEYYFAFDVYHTQFTMIPINNRFLQLNVAALSKVFSSLLHLFENMKSTDLFFKIRVILTLKPLQYCLKF